MQIFIKRKIFLVKYIRAHNKFENILSTFDKENKILSKKGCIHTLTLNILNIWKDFWNIMNLHKILVVATLQI
jgi:hypothetical protein